MNPVEGGYLIASGVQWAEHVTENYNLETWICIESRNPNRLGLAVSQGTGNCRDPRV